MKKTPIALMFAGAATTVALLSAPVLAAPTAVSDSDLDGIQGKSTGDNVFQTGSTAGTSTSTASLGGDNSANVQFVWYQWTDSHNADNSDHKGANDAKGDSSVVQQAVSGQVNAYFWGGLGQNAQVNNSSNISGGQENMGYGTFANGGF